MGGYWLATLEITDMFTSETIETRKIFRLMLATINNLIVSIRQKIYLLRKYTSIKFFLFDEWEVVSTEFSKSSLTDENVAVLFERSIDLLYRLTENNQLIQQILKFEKGPDLQYGITHTQNILFPDVLFGIKDVEAFEKINYSLSNHDHLKTILLMATGSKLQFKEHKNNDPIYGSSLGSNIWADFLEKLVLYQITIVNIDSFNTTLGNADSAASYKNFICSIIEIYPSYLVPYLADLIENKNDYNSIVRKNALSQQEINEINNAIIIEKKALQI